MHKQSRGVHGHVDVHADDQRCTRAKVVLHKNSKRSYEHVKLRTCMQRCTGTHKNVHTSKDGYTWAKRGVRVNREVCQDMRTSIHGHEEAHAGIESTCANAHV